MEKPHSFAGRVVKRNGKIIENDFPIIDKFFNEMRTYNRLLDEVPYKVIEELKNYESNRPIMIQILRRLYQIFDAAGLDVAEEIKKEISNPFDNFDEKEYEPN